MRVFLLYVYVAGVLGTMRVFLMYDEWSSVKWDFWVAGQQYRHRG